MSANIERLKRYLIADSSFYPSNPIHFSTVFKNACSRHLINFASLRGFSHEQSASLMPYFLEICDEFNVRAFINYDIDLAIKFGCGIHLKGTQIAEISTLAKCDMQIFYSAHSIDELLCASLYGANFATLSPIFSTPNKGAPLGVSILEQIPRGLSCEVFALGGVVTTSHIEELSHFCGVSGFASIRFFIDMYKNPR